jgi:hypothetical protein
MKQKLTLYILIGIILCSCAFESENNLEEIVDDFYQTYSERQDFDKFIDFYDESILLKDMINGDSIAGKEELKIFFDWNNPDFEKNDISSVIVNEKIVHDNKIVIQGYFTSFKWRDTKFEAMHFATVLTFNKAGKIIEQVDWINYPTNLVDYSKRKNSNDWLK